MPPLKLCSFNSYDVEVKVSRLFFFTFIEAQGVSSAW